MTFQQPTEPTPQNLESQAVLAGPGAGQYGSGDLSPSGTQVAVCHEQTVRIWEPATGRTVHVLDHPHDVWTARFSPDGRSLATGCPHETVRIWDVASGQVVSVLPRSGAHPAYPSLVFSPNGRHLLTGDSAGARIWNLGRKTPSKPVAPATSEGWSVAYSTDGTLFAVANATVIRIHNTTTLEVQQTLPRPEKAGPLAFAPDGATLATAAFAGTAIHDLATGTTKQTLTNPTASDNVNDVSFSPDGRLLATANWNHTARIWDTATANLLFTLIGHNAPVLSVAFAPDGLSVATCGDDSVRIWALPQR